MTIFMVKLDDESRGEHDPLQDEACRSEHDHPGDRSHHGTLAGQEEHAHRGTRTSSNTVELARGCVTEFKDMSAQQQHGSHHSFDPKLASNGATSRSWWRRVHGCTNAAIEGCWVSSRTNHTTRRPLHKDDSASRHRPHELALWWLASISQSPHGLPTNKAARNSLPI